MECLSFSHTHFRDPPVSKIAEALAGLIYVWKKWKPDREIGGPTEGRTEAGGWQRMGRIKEDILLLHAPDAPGWRVQRSVDTKRNQSPLQT